MVEVTNELIYEVLKKIQPDVSLVRTTQQSMSEELSAMRGHMVAMQKDIHNLYDMSHEHGRRLDRIEWRLELRDETCLSA